MSPYKSHIHHFASGSRSTHNHFYTGSRRPTRSSRSPSPAQPTSPPPPPPRRVASPESAARVRRPYSAPPTVGSVEEIGRGEGEQERGRAREREREQDHVHEYRTEAQHHSAPSARHAVEERVPRLWYGGAGIEDGVRSGVVNIGCPRFDLTMNMPDWFWDADRVTGNPTENSDGRGRGRERRRPREEGEGMRHAHMAHGSIRRDWMDARSPDEAELSDDEYPDRFQDHGHYASRSRYAYDDQTSDGGVNPRPRRRREHTSYPREHIRHAHHPPEHSVWHLNSTRQAGRYHDSSDPQDWEDQYSPLPRRTNEWQRSRSRRYAEWNEYITSEKRKEKKRRDKGEYIRLRGEEKAWVKRKSKSKSKSNVKRRHGIWGRGEVNDVDWRDEMMRFDSGRVRKERRVRLL